MKRKNVGNGIYETQCSECGEKYCCAYDEKDDGMCAECSAAAKRQKSEVTPSKAEDKPVAAA